jgi:hypothetical protein
MISEKIEEESLANFTDNFDSQKGLVRPFSNMHASQRNQTPPPVKSKLTNIP